ncbi:MAG TPA: hypothetical protein VMP08_17165 [Anaerolineae bacterium]|nr:hypothetical protein [Anaerolineae bacterium]
MSDLHLDAVIFIPGLGNWHEQSVDDIARRIAVSLDRNAHSSAAQFKLQPEAKEEEYVSDGDLARRSRVRTITRKDAAPEVPVLDVYEFDYQPILTRKYEHLNPVMQSVRLFSLLALNLPRLIKASRSRAKSGSAKAQFYMAVLIVSLLIVYMAFLFIAAAGVIGQAIVQAAQTVGVISPAAAPASGAPAPLYLGTLQSIVILVAAVQALWPKLREALLQGALTYTCVIEYITYGERRDVIAGQFLDLLEHLAEKGQYRQIHVIAYSFGSIIAIDALFPANQKASDRYSLIQTLSTIGCPYDLVRMIWPTYFEDRYGKLDWPQRWLNVYSPLDALASDFYDHDHKKGSSEKALQLAEGGERMPQNLVYRSGSVQFSPLAALALQGIRAHADYWEAEYESEVSCFTDIVQTLYADDALLQ